jgi:hypothetical protein
MPVLSVDGRLTTPLGRLELAHDVIGIMLHPKDKEAKRRRRSALAMTLLGMRDHDDELEALEWARSSFKRAGGFKTASQSLPYEKQQAIFLRQLPYILASGNALPLVWAMEAHHRTKLVGGASLGKAIAIMREYPVCFLGMSERGLWSAWSRYKPVAHLCTVFTFAFYEALQAPPGEAAERVKVAFDQELQITLSTAAVYEQFASNFRAHGTKRPLLGHAEMWSLRGIAADETHIPPPLSPAMLAVAQRYKAPRNIADR